ncbi:MAG: DEAD/DEAH box helicase family protein [Candidatus Dadabacteria bacterium]|nr:DEAD/DEAH box helicase family protein [Candidatus Dadabacteria bacterium]MDE0519435.1 DEAD/DEAH box helicase family protein [Candidatus Dadabacteria bacterium]MDE0663056.1 DEAD/DEAH box helicase family protein [Candidatus Dadabacteria bacterium]
MTVSTELPGVQPSQICEKLDDFHAAQLLPTGAFNLINAIDPGRINSSKRVETLSRTLSLELVINDTQRREILLNAVPQSKIGELEDRIGISINQLRQKDKLEQSLRRNLLGFFGFTTIANQMTTISESAKTVLPERGLFPHQKRAASDIERYLYFEEGRAMLHLPTGTGKTRTAMSIVASHLRTRPKGLVLWLAATRELLEQAATEFELTWRALGDRQVDCLRFWSSHNPQIDKITDGMVIAGLAKLHSYGKERKKLWSLGDRTTMVVFDEAHQAVATTYRDIIETVVSRNPKTPLLGLSATPGRTWGDPNIDTAVAELFCGNKVMISFNGSNPIKHLTDEGYLAEVDFSLLNVEPGLQLSTEDLAEISKALDISDDFAARFGEDEQRNLRIIQCLLELVETHSRILVFAASVDNALLLASVCRGMGLKADAVTAKTDSWKRKHVIQRFKRPGGPHRILINYGVLTTGFDAPAASAALIARPTKSLVLYSQMVGRVIRGPKAGGTKHCKVVTVVDTNLPGFGDVAEAFMNWEDVWNVA